jgi:hypothetical protein
MLARNSLLRENVPSGDKAPESEKTLGSTCIGLPELEQMRRYLDATGLCLNYDVDQARDARILALEVEGQLLRGWLEPHALLNNSQNPAKLEARFQKFRWTYAELYRSAHDQRQSAIADLIRISDDAENYLSAIRSLNRIAALGAPEGAEIETQITTLRQGILPCQIGDRLSPQSTPVCPLCDFILGAPSPEAELKAAVESLHRAVRNRLARLSKILIECLIREDAGNCRLETVARIMQVAKTDGLVTIWDDRIAVYLSRLLDGGNHIGTKVRTDRKAALLVKSV